MRLIESASVSILHSAASMPWWAWGLIAWVAFDVVFVALRWHATRERQAQQQIVFDIFDGKAVR